MKTALSLLSVMAALTLISFSSGCTKPAGEVTGVGDLQERKNGPPYKSLPDPVPYKPEDFGVLFDRSDVIAFAQVLEVTDVDEIRELEPWEKELVVTRFVGRQDATLKILRILKGPEELISETINIRKRRSTCYLTAGQKRVFYLTIDDDRQYHTTGIFLPPVSLAWTLSSIKNLELERELRLKAGVIVSVLSETAPLSGIKIHIFRGRLEVPVEIGDQAWENYLIETVETDEFGLSKVELPNGHYTFLLEFEGSLYSHSRFVGLVSGYYPFCIVENNWRPIFFRLDEIGEIHKESPRQ